MHRQLLVELKARRDAVAHFLTTLDRTIASLEALESQGLTLPGGAVALVAGDADVAPVPLGAGNISENIVRLLRTRAEPMTPAQIARSLLTRGVQTSSKYFRSTVFTLLKERARRVGDVGPVGDGTWVYRVPAPVAPVEADGA